MHVVCARVNEKFLVISKSQGNDFSTRVWTSAFPVSSLAIIGASAPRVGRNPLKPGAPRKWC